MPRKPLNHLRNLPYHITARSHDKEQFPIPMPEMWLIIQGCLKEAKTKHSIEVISFVLMSNHYHMLLLTPDRNLNAFMSEFNKRLFARVKSQIFEDHYKWCLIESQGYFINCYKYIYQNPVRAGIVEFCEDYPYSTLRAIVKHTKFSVPVHDKYGFKDEYGLRWVNLKVEDQYIKNNNLAFFSE